MAPRRSIAAVGVGLAVGLLSFAAVEAWTDRAFEGTARSAMFPLLVVGSAAAGSSAWLARRLQSRWWLGVAGVAAVWFAWWQFLLWQSLQEHG